MKTQVVILLSMLILLSSCSGLSETECAAIDWEQTGFEDGESGKDISTADEYEKSCSRHSVNVDMDAYSKGHEKGVRNFCQSENGFEIGKKGYRYNGICPADLEGAFLREYDIGFEFYFVYQSINEIESALSTSASTIDKLNRGISSALISLENPALTIPEQIQIEQNIRSMESQILEYERASLDLQSLLPERLRELQYLEDLYRR